MTLFTFRPRSPSLRNLPSKDILRGVAISLVCLNTFCSFTSRIPHRARWCEHPHGAVAKYRSLVHKRRRLRPESGHVYRLMQRLAAAFTVLVLLAGGSTAAFARDGLDTSSDTTYDIGADGAVHVEAVYTLTNTKGSTTSGRVITDYYFYAHTSAIPHSATNVTATSNGSALEVEISAIDDTPDLQRLTVTFPNLYNRQTRVITVAFDIAGEAPRTTESDERVNAAYASFYAIGQGDDGNVSVHVVAPATLDMEFFGAKLKAQANSSGKISYSEENISDPFKWYAFVSARNDEALVRTPVETAGVSVGVRSWPGDTAWADFATKEVRDGVPVLATLIDEPLPIKGLEVIQATTPYLYGAAGWFQPKNSVIEVGEELNDHVVLHELAHSWFNRTYFADRWMSEGLAEEYSSRAQALLTQTPREPEAVLVTGEGAQPLTSWNSPIGRKSSTGEQQEKYGYNTSFYVFHELLKEIDTPKMAAVYDSVVKELNPYQGQGELVYTTQNTDWKRLLDLVQEVGGSTKAEDLFKTYVLTPSQADGLSVRAAARSAYSEFKKSIGGWAMPAVVPAWMSDWKFADVTEFMTRAKATLARRDTLDAEAGANKLTVKADLQKMFESASTFTSFDDMDKVIEAQLAAIHRLAEVQPLVVAPRNFYQRIGLRGQQPDLDFDAARAAFNEGRLDDATVGADGVATLLGGAEKVGRAHVRQTSTRAGAGLFILLLAIVLLIRRRRKHRRLRAQSVESAQSVELVLATGVPRSLADAATALPASLPPPPWDPPLQPGPPLD
jgi:hypothetical protein